ncbi:MAG: hypothetical protein ACOC5K_00980 [Chloroflexota bacterium]
MPWRAPSSREEQKAIRDADRARREQPDDEIDEDFERLLQEELGVDDTDEG